MIYRYGHTAPLLRLSLPKHTQESRMPTEPHTLSHVIVGVFTLSLSLSLSLTHTHFLNSESFLVRCQGEFSLERKAATADSSPTTTS